MIRCGDSVDLLREIATDGIDVTITDPPYSDHVHQNFMVGGNGKGKPKKKDMGFASLSRPLRAQIAQELARVTKRWVLVFSDHEGSTQWGADLRYAGLDIVRYGIWKKRGAPPQFTGDRPAVGHEVIVIAHRPPPGNKKHWNGGGHHAVWEHTTARGKNRVHTTQKPDSLCDELVSLFTDPGEMVLDPFAGSGAILAAAARAGRRTYGIEIDSKYAELAGESVYQAIAGYNPNAGGLMGLQHGKPPGSEAKQKSSERAASTGGGNDVADRSESGTVKK